LKAQYLMTEIETERLLLRLMDYDDAPRLAEIANDARIAHMLGTMPHPYTLDDAHEYIAACRKHDKHAARFAICETVRPKEVIGATGYGPATIVGKDPEEIDFGYWLGVEYWGQGFATEAARAARDHAFMLGGVEQIDTDYLTVNPGSGKVLVRLGFEQVAERTCHSRGSGERRPSIHVRLTRQSWQSLKEAGR
jgi:RimJ/RimL family protein N-acetyltransferase